MTADTGKDVHSAEQIGSSVRSRRNSVAMSVRGLARLSGFSASFVSQVENGQASPSNVSLVKIASALDLTLGSFFATSMNAVLQHAEIVRAGEGRSLTSEWSLATIRSLGQSGSDSSVETLMVELAAGGKSGHEFAPRQVETSAFVAEGTLLLHLPDDVQSLTSGEAVTVSAGIAHLWTNESYVPTRLLMVSSHKQYLAG